MQRFKSPGSAQRFLSIHRRRRPPLAAPRHAGPPRPRRRASKDERQCPTERADNSRQARRRCPAGPGSAPGRVRWNASRKRRLVLGPAGAADIGRGGAQAPGACGKRRPRAGFGGRSRRGGRAPRRRERRLRRRFRAHLPLAPRPGTAAARRPEGFGFPANHRARACGNATLRRRFWLRPTRQTAGLVDRNQCPIRLHYRT